MLDKTNIFCYVKLKEISPG